MNRSFLIGTLFLLALLSSLKVKAQFAAHFNQYWDLNGYYNPAWAGQAEKLNVYGTYSMQMTAFTRAPRSMYFGADMPFSLFNKRQGAGIGFLSESIGLFRNQRVWLQYSYKQQIKKGKLGVGLQLGIYNISFDPTQIELGETGADDPAFPKQESSGAALDLGVGGFYSHPKFYVGLSAQHLTAPRVELKTSENSGSGMSEFSIKPMLYFTGGYNIQLRNPLISIQPSLLVQSDLIATRADLTGRFFYTYEEKKFAAGVTYSPGVSFTFSLGATIKSVTVGYAYEVYTSAIGAAGGSHDLVVSYAMDVNMFKKSKNKHKSVRIL